MVDCQIPKIIPEGTVVFKKVKQKKITGKITGLPSNSPTNAIYYNVKWSNDKSEAQYTRSEIINKLLPPKHPIVEKERELQEKAEGGEKEKLLKKAELHIKQADA